MKKLTDFPDVHLRIFDRPGLPDANQVSDVFLIGICGTGMGSLATLFADGGYTVSGSDKAAYPPMSETLAELGITVREGFDAENLIPAPGLVIIGNACTPTHVEASFAREQNMTQASFPEALTHYFIRDRKSIVVAGTHGKTTTTSLLVHVFKSAGIDPGYLIGGVLSDGTPNTANGSADYFLVEGDEYDSAYFDKRPKFMHYRPSSAIVTSVEFDHADIYDSIDDCKAAFEEFAALLPADGLLVLNADDDNAAELQYAGQSRICLYSTSSELLTGLSARNVSPSTNGIEFELLRDGQPIGEFRLGMFGLHNLSNALAVAAIALDEDISVAHIQNAFAGFAGIQRRQEIIGEANGITVVDDFAHHPTAVRATIKACRSRWPERRIVAIFEPRSNSSRRKVFEDGYSKAFSEADAAFMIRPPFRHNDRKSDFMDIDTILARLHQQGIEAQAAPDIDDLLTRLKIYLRSGDIALIMSNGGFGNIHRRLLADLNQSSRTLG
ncbi:MAG: UDP-N-acetylmuramate--L-alanine ligase [Bacteroidetes bacterium]|nr:MAG: UDP-N-acetylmuramate--L-alanine ligase [Bacteroidota bacterium]